MIKRFEDPQNAPVPAEEEAEYESLLPMSLAIRLIGDHLEFMDYVLVSVIFSSYGFFHWKLIFDVTF